MAQKEYVTEEKMKKLKKEKKKEKQQLKKELNEITKETINKKTIKKEISVINPKYQEMIKKVIQTVEDTSKSIEPYFEIYPIIKEND